MIHYHGLPITSPSNLAAVSVLNGGHGFCSFAERSQLGMCVELCQSFAIDNGAFSAWKSGKSIKDWSEFYQWADMCRKIPNCDFAVIPDVIDGAEQDNDDLLDEWPLGKFFGSPVWHMHESMERLQLLSKEYYRVCIGSSGEFSSIGNDKWWGRIAEAMRSISDSEGYIPCKLHGLRMLNPAVFTKIPFSSADSTAIARSIGIDSKWTGSYRPIGKEARAVVMKQRIESFNSPEKWADKPIQKRMFG